MSQTMSLDAKMSREEKEKLLSEKMENIRKRNEELRKRHEEIEADKKNADKFSSTVTMDKVKPYVMKSPRTRTEKTERPRDAHDPPPIPRPSDIMPARQRLSENDGPPPDPSYRFLSDPDRDGNDKDRRRDGRGRKKGKQGAKRGASDEQEEDEARLEFEDDKIDISQGNVPSDHNFSGNRNRGSGSGRGKSEIANGDQRSGTGRGRGHGKGYERYQHERDGEHQNADFARSGDFNEGGDRGKMKGKGNLSFASRDIRYYPDENEDHSRSGRDGRGRGRGRQNFNQRNYSDENHNRSHRQGGFESHRGRGRGRNREQQKEYERWKAERAAIDEARLTRGKNNEGSWRREWDNDKISQGEVEEYEPGYDPRYPRSKTEKFKLADLVNLPNNDGSVQQPGHKHEKIKNERKTGSGRESIEKFVKVDTERVQKQPKLGSNDVIDLTQDECESSAADCNEEYPPGDKTISDCADMKDASEESPAEHSSPASPIDQDISEGMESNKEFADPPKGILIDECEIRSHNSDKEAEAHTSAAAEDSMTSMNNESITIAENNPTPEQLSVDDELRNDG